MASGTGRAGSVGTDFKVCELMRPAMQDEMY